MCCCCCCCLLHISHISATETDSDSSQLFFLRRSKRIPRDNHVLLSLLWVKYAVDSYMLHHTAYPPYTPEIFIPFLHILFFLSFSFVSSLLEAKRLLKCVEKNSPFRCFLCYSTNMCMLCLWFLRKKFKWIWNGGARKDLFVVILWKKSLFFVLWRCRFFKAGS